VSDFSFSGKTLTEAGNQGFWTVARKNSPRATHFFAVLKNERQAVKKGKLQEWKGVC
jgi:hypothetical protein